MHHVHKDMLGIFIMGFHYKLATLDMSSVHNLTSKPTSVSYWKY